MKPHDTEYYWILNGINRTLQTRNLRRIFDREQNSDAVRKQQIEVRTKYRRVTINVALNCDRIAALLITSGR